MPRAANSTVPIARQQILIDEAYLDPISGFDVFGILSIENTRRPNDRARRVARHGAVHMQICLARANARMAAHSLTSGENRSMASVKIDLGFGEQAVLSERAASGIVTARHQRDAEEFLRRWPRTRSIHQERDYLRQLRLHVEFNPPGVNSSDTSALLRSAVQSGKVMAVIERATTRFGGAVGTPRPTRGSGAIGSSRQSFTEMAAGGGGASAILSDAASAPKSYSWMQSYDDVSSDDLINYVQSVVSGMPGEAAAIDDIDSSTPLGDAQAFEYSDESPTDGAFEIAKTPNTGEPGTWYTNPGSGQMRLYGGDGNPAVDFDFDHDHGQGIPHAHNWAINPLTGKSQRGPGVPMSILP